MKLLKFFKENKVIVFALLVVLLSFGLLALPGQFAHYVPDVFSGSKRTFVYNLSGYQWIFGTVKYKYNADAYIGKASAQGIAAFSILVLCVPGLLFSKKSSFVALLTSLALITAAVLFLSISAAGVKSYPNFHIRPENSEYTLMRWVPYVIGSFLVLVGGLMTYRTVMVMKNEVARPSQAKGPTYSYLHK